ncbi:MAG: hypothetical protein FRX48_06203 [Lasallia pustulata]|uniref:Uncharacterized protein n=1 Tax=Lasallia pustulata TaxID=136370 RepID=A0A5M8PL12_9LECA|nr:MAG: hypothetical protein FRX48_06203 [Lasallia pustulata]
MVYSEHRLPEIWNKQMDFFICDCDARDVNPKLMLKTLKTLFPELKRDAGQVSLEKIEIRIRVLDATPAVKYFKPGAVARYRQLVEEGRLEDRYPEDVNYLNSEEMLKDSEFAVFDGAEEGGFANFTVKGKGKHVRTLSGGFLDPGPSENRIRPDYEARYRGSDDNSKTQATSLLDQLRERSEPNANSPPIKLSPATETARARAANLKERMQARHPRGSSFASEGHGMSGHAGNVDVGRGVSPSIRAVGVEDVFGGMSLNAMSSSGRARH